MALVDRGRRERRGHQPAEHEKCLVAALSDREPTYTGDDERRLGQQQHGSPDKQP